MENETVTSMGSTSDVAQDLFDKQAAQAVANKRDGASANAIKIEQVEGVIGVVVQRYEMALAVTRTCLPYTASGTMSNLGTQPLYWC